MGSVGNAKSENSNDFGLGVFPKAEVEKYTDFNGQSGAEKWFSNPKLSNMTEWQDNGLTSDEYEAIHSYTGSSYGDINRTLYNTPWEELSNSEKERLKNIYNGLSKFELHKGINVTRHTDFKIFGKNGSMTEQQVKNFLSQSGGVLQNDAFMSFSASNHGFSLSGSGLAIHLSIPPSKGAGAYVAPISQFHDENEYLLNNNAVLRFDANSVHKGSDGNIHVNAVWLGQAKTQTISPTNKSKLAKKK